MVDYTAPLEWARQGWSDGQQMGNAFARQRAGNALARGDMAGGANALNRAGLLDEAGQLQDRQFRNEELQYRRDSREAEVAEKRRERADAERKEKLAFTGQVITALQRVKQAGGDVLSAYDQVAPAFMAMESDPERRTQTQQTLAQIRAALGQNPDAVLSALGEQTRKELIKGEHGQLDLYDPGTQSLTPLRGPQPYMEGGYLFTPQGGEQNSPPPNPVREQNSGSTHRDAIAAIESRGGGDYKAVGPVTRTGDRAYGRYQVMGANIPQWTKEVLGRSMTPQEFVANPQAQDAVFDAKFGGFIQKYGSPEEAASVWFTGQPMSRGANRRDVNGMSGAQYVQKFAQNAGQPQLPGRETASDVPQIPGWNVQRMAAEDGWRPDPSTPGFLISGKGDVKADPRAPKPKETDPSKVFTQENQLRTGYGQQPAVKDIAAVRSQIGIIGAIAKKARDNPGSVTAQDDLALIFAFMKMLDPTSVVREGEFANAQNTGGIPDRVVNAYNKALKGTRLNDKQRAEFFNTATMVMDSYTNATADQAERYRGMAQSYGLTPDRVAPNVQRPKDRSTKPAQGGKPSGRRLSPQEAAKLKPGTRFIGMDGVERVRQ